jgi:RNA polymerase sigma-70 factor (ECF subfamily)
MNENVFKEIFYRSYPKLFQLAHSYVRSREIAEELVQDAFLKVWQNRKSINTVEAYLHTTVKNLSLNHLKSKYHRDHSGFLEIDDSDQKNAHAENELENKELEAAIEEGISLLPEKCRVAFILTRDQEMTYQEVASHLGVSKETVKSQIKIALRKLKNHLDQMGLLFF